MASCAVRGCCSRRAVDKKHLSGITFHRFPKDPKRQQLWTQFVGRGDWKPTKCSVLCSQHFTDECFDRTSQCYVRLKTDAIPMIYQGDPLKLPKVPSLSNIVIAPPPTTFVSVCDSSEVKVECVDPTRPTTPVHSNSASLENTNPITPGEHKSLNNPLKLSEVSSLSNILIAPPPTAFVSVCDLPEVNMHCVNTTRPDTPVHSSPASLLNTNPITPAEHKLLNKVSRLSLVSNRRKQKLGLLRKKLSRKEKRIASMKTIIKALRKKNFMLEEALARLGDPQELYLEEYKKNVKKLLLK